MTDTRARRRSRLVWRPSDRWIVDAAGAVLEGPAVPPGGIDPASATARAASGSSAVDRELETFRTADQLIVWRGWQGPTPSEGARIFDHAPLCAAHDVTAVTELLGTGDSLVRIAVAAGTPVIPIGAMVGAADAAPSELIFPRASTLLVTRDAYDDRFDAELLPLDERAERHM